MSECIFSILFFKQLLGCWQSRASLAGDHCLKVHLTPKFFFHLKEIFLLWWVFLRKNCWIWVIPHFFYALWSRDPNEPQPRKWGSGQSRLVTSLREDAQGILSQSSTCESLSSTRFILRHICDQYRSNLPKIISELYKMALNTDCWVLKVMSH